LLGLLAIYIKYPSILAQNIQGDKNLPFFSTGLPKEEASFEKHASRTDVGLG
jgi:hypothetical protein